MKKLSEDKINKIIEVLSINLKLLRYIKRRFIGHIKLYNKNLKVLEGAIDSNLNDIINIYKILKKYNFEEELETFPKSKYDREMYT